MKVSGPCPHRVAAPFEDTLPLARGPPNGGSIKNEKDRAVTRSSGNIGVVNAAKNPWRRTVTGVRTDAKPVARVYAPTWGLRPIASTEVDGWRWLSATTPQEHRSPVAPSRAQVAGDGAHRAIAAALARSMTCRPASGWRRSRWRASPTGTARLARDQDRGGPRRAEPEPVPGRPGRAGTARGAGGRLTGWRARQLTARTPGASPSVTIRWWAASTLSCSRRGAVIQPRSRFGASSRWPSWRPCPTMGQRQPGYQVGIIAVRGGRDR